jgi:hypothetical protein
MLKVVSNATATTIAIAGKTEDFGSSGSTKNFG